MHQVPSTLSMTSDTTVQYSKGQTRRARAHRRASRAPSTFTLYPPKYKASNAATTTRHARPKEQHLNLPEPAPVPLPPLLPPLPSAYISYHSTSTMSPKTMSEQPLAVAPPGPAPCRPLPMAATGRSRSAEELTYSARSRGRNSSSRGRDCKAQGSGGPQAREVKDAALKHRHAGVWLHRRNPSTMLHSSSPTHCGRCHPETSSLRSPLPPHRYVTPAATPLSRSATPLRPASHLSLANSLPAHTCPPRSSTPHPPHLEGVVVYAARLQARELPHAGRQAPQAVLADVQQLQAGAQVAQRQRHQAHGVAVQVQVTQAAQRAEACSAASGSGTHASMLSQACMKDSREGHLFCGGGARGCRGRVEGQVDWGMAGPWERSGARRG